MLILDEVDLAEGAPSNMLHNLIVFKLEFGDVHVLILPTEKCFTLCIDFLFLFAWSSH